MKVAISQPTYLPWLGYFDLIDQVDCFILLDTVQFEKRSWQQRNRIKGPTGLEWLSVPVISHGRFSQSIIEVEIHEAGFWRKHLDVVQLNYRHSPFFSCYFPELEETLCQSAAASCLAEVNVGLICWFCRLLGIQTSLRRSSLMGQAGRRSELLVNLIRVLNGSYYLSPLGSAAYLLNDLQQFSSAGIEVGFQNYPHPQYTQQFPPFCPYASVLDLVFNEGPRSLEIIRSGRETPLLPSQVALRQNAP
jgi:WbqC-like protein